MTRYRALVDDQLLDGGWPVEGLALVSVDGPWKPGISICTVDDSTAPERVAGQLLIPHVIAAEQGKAAVAVRYLMSE